MKRWIINIRDKKGIALVMAMIFILIGFGMIAAMVQLIKESIRMSGMEKRYTTAVGAAKGGAEIIVAGINTGNFSIGTINNKDCLQEKLNSDWREKNQNGWDHCSPDALDPNVKNTPDIRIDLGDYRIFIKIVDKNFGNTYSGEYLAIKGVVSGGSKLPSYPNLYRIEIISENTANPNDRAELTVLYAL